MKNWMKRVSLLILAAGLAGCSSAAETSSEETAVREVVTSYLDDFKSGDLNAADSYLSDNASQYALGNALDQMDAIYASAGLDENSVAQIKSTLNDMLAHLISSYDITSVSLEDDEATVNVKVNGLTLDELENLESADLLDAIREAISTTDGGIDSDALSKGMKVLLDKVAELPTKDYNATFLLDEQDGEWKIDQITNLIGD